jgi:hypothetical protein
MGINRLKDEILFKKDIFDLLHLGTGEDKQKKIITKNTKHKLLYQLYSTVQESDIDNRLTAMEQEIEKSNTTSEEIAYLKRKIKNAE